MASVAGFLSNVPVGVQVAFGSVLLKDVDSTQKGSCPVLAGRVANVAVKFFLTTVKGFKHGCKLSGIVDQSLQLMGTSLGKGSPVGALCKALSGAKNLATCSEVFSRLEGVFTPLQEYSSFADKNGGDQDAGLYEQLLAKGADLADWTMSVADTHQWLAKLGFVTANTFAMGVIFNAASAVYIFNSLKEEVAKWWTDKVVSQTDTSLEFDKIQKVKSLFLLTISAAYAVMTAVAVAELAGYVVASSAVLMLASSATAWVAIVGNHFWEELFVEQ